jgi:SAM-dependent methyltransferase
VARTLSDQHLRCKLCDRDDFRDKGFRELIEELYGPSEGEERRRWEGGMAMRAFDALGVLSEDAKALVVGGDAEAVDWMRRSVGRVDHLPAPTGRLRLHHDDESFGVVRCSSTLERLSGLEEARGAMVELYRVLRRGGVAAVAAPFRLEGPPPGPPGILLLDEAELREAVLGGGLAWAIATTLDTAASSAVVERQDGHAWTSVHLLLVKPLFH